MSRLTRRETSWVTAFRRFIVAATSAGTCYHARDYVTYGGAAFATGRINFFENINGASKIRSLQADLRQAKRITRRIISVTSFAFFFSIDFSFVFHDLWVASLPRAIAWHSFRWARGFYPSISILKEKNHKWFAFIFASIIISLFGILYRVAIFITNLLRRSNEFIIWLNYKIPYEIAVDWNRNEFLEEGC